MDAAELVRKLNAWVPGTRFKYVVRDEFRQVIAVTVTRWTADCLVAGILASDSPTSRLGSWSIEQILIDSKGAADHVAISS